MSTLSSGDINESTERIIGKQSNLIIILCCSSRMDSGIPITTKDRMMPTGDKDPATLLDRALISPTHCTTQQPNHRVARSHTRTITRFQQ